MVTWPMMLLPLMEEQLVEGPDATFKETALILSERILHSKRKANARCLKM